MTFREALRETYGGAWRFMLALPVIAVAVVGVEGLQHIVEWRSGFYASFAGMKDSAHDAGRMITGSLKVAWLTVIGYWATRFLVSRSARDAIAPDPVAIRKFAWVLLFSALVGAVTLFGADFLPAAGPGRGVGMIAILIFNLAGIPIGVAIIPWTVGAALGDERASIPFAFRRAWGSILWGLALTIVALLPLMVAHYALSYSAVGRPPFLAISMLTVDALLVAYLGVVMAMSQVVVAEHMAQRAGETLALGGPPANIRA